MKQEYLWDKSGSDPEIENLENALAVFRYKETAPPALPAKVIGFKKETSRRSFRFAYAVAACAAFAMIGWGAWYQFSGYEVEFQENLVKTISPQNPEAPNPNAIEIPVATKIDLPPDVAVETPKQISVRKSVKANKIAQSNISQKTEKIKKVEPKSTEVRLTKEEKYAYDQLMLALSITSSKLKMVKDKVQNLDEETTIVEKGR